MMKRFFITLFLAVSLHSWASPTVQVTITNRLPIDRKGEIVELDYTRLLSALGLTSTEQIVVVDAAGVELASQITYDQKLIFPASVSARGKSQYTVKAGVPQTYPVRAYGRFVPERKDDYAWENNRMAYRVYGLVLKQTEGPNNGVDIWTKRVERMIIDEWYANKHYHEDHGTGQDCYMVGRTLGGGMVAPMNAGELVLGEGFLSYQTLDQGPLRHTVRLRYAPLKVGNHEVIEVREISLNANAYFNKMKISYEGNYGQMPIAAGITLHKGAGEKRLDSSKGIATYWERQYDLDVLLGTAIFFPKQTKVKAVEQEGHALLITTITPDQTLTYYFGAGWNKFGFKDSASWNTQVDQSQSAVNSPLVIHIKY